MPIDPSIPLAVTQPKFNTPFEAMGQAMQLRQQQQEQQANTLKLQEAQRQAKEQEQIRQYISNPSFTRESFLENVRLHVPGQYQAARDQFDKADKAAAEAKKLLEDTAKVHAEAVQAAQAYTGGLGAVVKAQNYSPAAFELALQTVELHFPQMADQTAAYRKQVLQDPTAIKSITDGLIASTPSVSEAGTASQNAATTADRLNVERPGLVADATIKGQVAAGMKGGLTPEQQSTQKQGAQRIALEQQRINQEGENNQATPTLSPEGLNLTAHQYAMTGQLPPMGMGKQGAAVRTAIINKAADIYKGLDLPTQVAAYKANQQSLTKLQGQRDAMGAFEQTALKNLDQFLDTAGKVVDTGSPLINKPLRSLSGALMGSPEMSAYDTARRTVIPEFAKILANPGLSGQLSDSARKEVEAVVSGDATLKQTLAAAKILKTDAANRRTSYDDQIKAIQDRIATPPGTNATPAATAPTTIGRFKVEIH